MRYVSATEAKQKLHTLCVLRPAACGTRERVEIPLTDASHVAVEVG